MDSPKDATIIIQIQMTVTFLSRLIKHSGVKWCHVVRTLRIVLQLVISVKLKNLLSNVTGEQFLNKFQDIYWICSCSD